MLTVYVTVYVWLRHFGDALQRSWWLLVVLAWILGVLWGRSEVATVLNTGYEMPMDPPQRAMPVARAEQRVPTAPDTPEANLGFLDGSLQVVQNTPIPASPEPTRTVPDSTATNIQGPGATNIQTNSATNIQTNSANIQTIIIQAAAEFGADGTQMLRVAKCESGFNPLAKNPGSTASGLFQFLTSTWAGNAPRLGYGPADIWNPTASARVAAWMFAHGQAGQWVCK